MGFRGKYRDESTCMALLKQMGYHSVSAMVAADLKSWGFAAVRRGRERPERPASAEGRQRLAGLVLDVECNAKNDADDQDYEEDDPRESVVFGVLFNLENGDGGKIL